MAYYADEEEVWKCPKHPSRRRRNGICPTCLRDRLVTLCPDCANVRPCACAASSATTSSSSSSSSSFSHSRSTRVPLFGRASNFLDGEPSLRRSRSVAIPFLSSRFAGDSVFGARGNKTPATGNRSRSSFWSVFRSSKNNKTEGEEEDRESEESKRNEVEKQEDYMMMRSRSVPVNSDSSGGELRSAVPKRRGWFPNPMKVFRQSKTSKVVQERSPLYRG